MPYSVWCIDDISPDYDSDWKERVSLVCTLDNLKDALDLREALENKWDEENEDSRNPDWNFFFFVQEKGKPCYVLDREIEKDALWEEQEYGNVYHCKEEAIKAANTFNEQRDPVHKSVVTEIGPFIEEDLVSWPGCEMLFHSEGGSCEFCDGSDSEDE